MIFSGVVLRNPHGPRVLKRTTLRLSRLSDLPLGVGWRVGSTETAVLPRMTAEGSGILFAVIESGYS